MKEYVAAIIAFDGLLRPSKMLVLIKGLVSSVVRHPVEEEKIVTDTGTTKKPPTK